MLPKAPKRRNKKTTASDGTGGEKRGTTKGIRPRESGVKGHSGPSNNQRTYRGKTCKTAMAQESLASESAAGVEGGGEACKSNKGACSNIWNKKGVADPKKRKADNTEAVSAQKSKNHTRKTYAFCEDTKNSAERKKSSFQ